MRKLVSLLLCLLAVGRVTAQDLEGPGSLPIEINSTGGTTYENGLATARDNVAIHFGDTDIYSDFAQYDSIKRTVLLRGHVRIYRGISLYLADNATYNIDTKAITAAQDALGDLPLPPSWTERDERVRRRIRGQTRKLHDARRRAAGFSSQRAECADLSERPGHFQIRDLLCRQGADLLVALPLPIT